MTREPWLIHFFQRHPADDPNRAVPAIEFFDRLPAKLVAEFQAVLDAVAEAPPTSVPRLRQVRGNARRDGRLLRAGIGALENSIGTPVG